MAYARLLCTLAFFVSLGGCSDSASSTSSAPDTQTTPEEEDVQTAEPDIQNGADCETDEECGEPEPCQLALRCEEGICVEEWAVAETPCGTFCNPGICSAKGTCELQPPYECPEIDGNLCTSPTCDVAVDECVEKALPTGSEPYAENECYVDAVCVDGEVDTTNAGPSEMALGCDALTADLDPQGCIDRYECVGGDIGCEPVARPDGAQCWIAEAGSLDDTCIGHSCVAGSCTVDMDFQVECGESNYPEDCGADCQACSQLTCHWIPDPANPMGNQHIAYCQAAAKIGDVCTVGSSCAQDQACVLGSQSDGPLGKETLGQCAGGTEKTKEDCAEELGLPALPCVLAGITCDPVTGGCFLDEDIAGNYCAPPSALCYDATNTYCTHLDAGENWDPETGCHIAWADVDCDDSNSCTVDTCSKDEGAWKCDHAPVEGAACDDGDSCTTGGLCEEGQCDGIVPVCQDTDGDPCTGVACFTGSCEEVDLDGAACDDDNPCTLLTVCSGGSCSGGEALPCDDGNACTDDYCDPLSGCLSLNNTGDCEDGELCTQNDTCSLGTCLAGTPLACDDGELCTDDFCEEGDCQGTPNTAACDDGNSCTENDACDNGTCTGTLGLVSCTDSNMCTEDLCLPGGGCEHNPIPDGFPCDGGGAKSCQSGVCTCVPQCDGITCDNDDGCGEICGCGEGETCSASKCVAGGTGDVDYDGSWYVTGNNSMVPNSMVLDFDAATNSVSGYGVIQIINQTVNYTGTYNHPDFTLEGSYTYAGLFGSGVHNETWTLTLNSPTNFTGILEDTAETATFSVNGNKTD